MKTKQEQREQGKRRLLVMKQAGIQAGYDFDFASAGFNPLKFTKDQQSAIRSALVSAAESGAARAFDLITSTN